MAKKLKNKYVTFNFEGLAKFGWRLACCERDFLGTAYHFYFVPANLSDSLEFFPDTLSYLKESFPKGVLEFITNDPRFWIVIKVESYV